MITIDGSQGEGGGQILRTALGLSLATGQPFAMHRIRAGRRKPGLLRQHLTAVQAARAISRAEVEGAELGSQSLTFRPRPVQPGKYRFAVGTAGSATLVLQTVLPALMTASGPSDLILEGGTHNPMAPPFDFLEKTFLPLVRRLGPAVEVRLDRPGFYPAGGGRFEAAVQPVDRLEPLHLPSRTRPGARRARVLLAHLAPAIAEQELQIVRRQLGWKEEDCLVEPLSNSPGPGNVVMLELESDQVTELITGFGQRGAKAASVARQATDEARRYLAAGVPVGEHLADQLLVPLALAGAGSFWTLPPTRHTRTNIQTIAHFLDLPIEIIATPERTAHIRVGPHTASPSQISNPKS